MALRDANPVAFIGVTDATKTKHFYAEKLGLKLVSEQLPFALVFDSHGVMLRATLVETVNAAPYTVLGWDVSDLDATVRAMRRAGVEFEIFPGLNDDNELSIWIAPGGSRIAWFRDPDGNMLSVSQMTA